MEVVSPDAAHAMEEECLFFVALSRAKQILRISKCRKTSDGKNRTPSPYLDWLVPTVVTEVSNAGMLPLPADARRPMPIRITWPAGWSVTDSRLRTFERCPRRFFYTHVLGLGGRRKVTPFSQTHDCLYQLIRWLAEARVEGDVSHAEAEKEFERLWSDGGPLDHAYATDYRRLADRLVGVLVKLGAGHRFRRSEPLAINLRSGRVIVEPDEMTELSDGTVILRKVRTGYKRSDEYDRTEYSLYHLAGRQRFGDAYAVEALHLSDENLEAVIIKPPKLKTRQGRSETMLGDIGAGRFPPDPDQVTCPRCPHFFVCDAVGRGPLALTEF